LPCVFCRGARQRVHGSILHGKVPLPCATSDNARQKKATDGTGCKRCMAPFVVRPGAKRTAKNPLCCAPGLKTHGKEGPLCRASGPKTHGNK
jgi:hypothetical protein